MTCGNAKLLAGSSASGTQEQLVELTLQAALSGK